MKRLILSCSVLLIAVLSACAPVTVEPEASKEGDGPLVTVYRAPT